MLNIKKVNKKLATIREVAIPFEDGSDPILISYSRQKLTAKKEMELHAINQQSLQVTALANFLATLITDWNISFTNSEGKEEKAPITPAFMEEYLGPETLQAFAQKIFNDINPNLPFSEVTQDS